MDLTPEIVADRVDAIRDIADDPEQAHSTEDALRHEVLRAIAEGHPDPQGLAKLALTTSAIDFARWCA